MSWTSWEDHLRKKLRLEEERSQRLSEELVEARTEIRVLREEHDRIWEVLYTRVREFRHESRKEAAG